MELRFEPGKNIAIKIPKHEYSATVRFYRDVLGLRPLAGEATEESPRFEFGDKVLWLDCVAGLSQSEIWLEVLTNNTAQAAQYLSDQGVCLRNEIEPLPEGMDAFWVASPTNIIHLVMGAELH